MKTPQIIGLAGKKRVGKDTFAHYMNLEFGYNGFAVAVVGFADTLRTIGLDMGWEPRYLYEDKDEIHPIWEISWRQFAQKIGTDCLRNNFRSDVWLKCMDIRLATMNLENGKYDVVIITDVRFDNEAEYIMNHGGLIVHILRDTGLSDSHESENGLHNCFFEKYNGKIINIMNNSTFGHLQIQAKELARSVMFKLFAAAVPPYGQKFLNIDKFAVKGDL